jgi:hypothetical protein
LNKRRGWFLFVSWLLGGFDGYDDEQQRARVFDDTYDGRLVRRKNRWHNHLHADKKDDVELGTSQDDRGTLTKIALDISDGSKESSDSKGMKEQAMRRPPQTKEITV